MSQGVTRRTALKLLGLSAATLVLPSLVPQSSLAQPSPSIHRDISGVVQMKAAHRMAAGSVVTEDPLGVARYASMDNPVQARVIQGVTLTDADAGEWVLVRLYGVVSVRHTEV